MYWKNYFLGIDVHKRTYSVTAICEGCMVKHDTFAASPQMLVKYCQRAFKGATLKSAYEAGFCGFCVTPIFTYSWSVKYSRASSEY